MATWTTDDIPDQRGRLAIVTGATGGLGLETALALAGAGAEVVLAGRNPLKGDRAERMIRDRHPHAEVRFGLADLADLASIAAFGDRLLADGRPIDILVNNAGVMALPRRETTADGFERQFGVNYLSHFALTGRLLPLLTAGRARVVQLSSMAHHGGRIRLDDLNHAHGYRPWPVYQQSKLAMLMFAVELQRRSDAHGWGLTSVAAHPGVANTDLMSNGPGGLTGFGARLFLPLLTHSAAAGALPSLMAATLPAGCDAGRLLRPAGAWRMARPARPRARRPGRPRSRGGAPSLVRVGASHRRSLRLSPRPRCGRVTGRRFFSTMTKASPVRHASAIDSAR
ncbi:SDR family oxidoreductase [Brevundimonas albigilva]|uniref:SDR family oxidoreductase n=1 Tax=Brevundimonas albigilva TaxID=1312364 RepID=UPI00201B46FB|nr:SDR family oxidoreductase [Brevundimonas albigilva]UQV17916.1 SDR family oxidoreductase [Brevundimonas albigilva]